MKKSAIKSKLRRSGFVYTDLGSGVRVTARGPQSPSTEGTGEERTVVKAQRDGEILDSTTEPTHTAAASRYVQYLEKHR